MAGRTVLPGRLLTVRGAQSSSRRCRRPSPAIRRLEASAKLRREARGTCATIVVGCGSDARRGFRCGCVWRVVRADLFAESPIARGEASVRMFDASAFVETPLDAPSTFVVHRRRDAIKHAAVALDDRLGRLGPGERGRVLVPTAHIGSEVLAQRFLGWKVSLAQRLLAQDPEEPSTRLSQEALVGVKWKCTGGCASSQAITSGVPCEEELSRMTCSSCDGYAECQVSLVAPHVSLSYGDSTVRFTPRRG